MSSLEKLSSEIDNDSNLYENEDKRLYSMISPTSEFFFSSKKYHDFSLTRNDTICFLPNIVVKVAVKLYTPDVLDDHLTLKERTVQKLNPHIYEIKVTHGCHIWTVYRRYHDFMKLREHILLKKATLKIPMPSKQQQTNRKSFKIEKSEISGDKMMGEFPKKLDLLISAKELPNRLKQLENYLQHVCNYRTFLKMPDLLRFLSVSPLSFIGSLGIKRKEDLVKKRCGGNNEAGCFNTAHNFIVQRWKTRWLVLKDNAIILLDLKKGRVGDVMLLDRDFSVDCGKKATGFNRGVVIKNTHRRLVFHCPHERTAHEWVKCINDVMLSTGFFFIHPNIHNSFVPKRYDAPVNWFVDGSSYMNNVAKSLEGAKEEIFIADWWLSPEIQLIRPDPNNYWQVQSILKRKALGGVKIFVLLFKELSLALNNNSLYTKTTLRNLHQNIQVLRHPDRLKKRVLFWSHHEKLVIIDQKVAYLGGLDLCYGRWDTRTHPINDVREVKRQEMVNNIEEAFGQSMLDKFRNTLHSTVHPFPHGQIQNSNITAHTNETTRASAMSERLQHLMNKKFLSSMIHNKQQQENDQFNKNEEKEMGVLFDNPINESENVPRKSLKNAIRNKLPSVFVRHKKEAQPLFVGKDYVNWIVKDCNELDKPDADLVDRGLIPRMPWHDIGCVVYGMAARDVARHFIERWNAVKNEKMKKNLNYSLLIPKAYVHSEVQRNSIFNTYKAFSCQILRSISTWSANANYTEDSILQAYLDAIRNAQHYVYIENQFFVSSTDPNSTTIMNTIAYEILKRIVYWKARNRKFRVYIMIPLLPAFEADIECKSGALYTILGYVYRSLFRGPGSLVQEIIKNGLEPDEHLFIGSLRSYGWLTTVESKPSSNEMFEELSSSDFKSKTNIFNRPPETIKSRSTEESGGSKGHDGFIGKEPLSVLHESNEETHEKDYPKSRFSLSPFSYKPIERVLSRSISKNRSRPSEQFSLLRRMSEVEVKKSILHINDGTYTKRSRFQLATLPQRETKRVPRKHAMKKFEKIISRSSLNHKLSMIKHQKSVDISTNHYEKGKYKPGTNTKHMIKLLPLNRTSDIYHSKSDDLSSSGNNKNSSINTPDICNYFLPVGSSMHDDPKVLVTEQIYIHSKLMIVDDRISIIGSSNINDRSLLGYRDSEIGILIEDDELEEDEFDGVKVKIGSFSSSLRKSLMREHLGILNVKSNLNIDDPISDEFWQDIWCKTAKNNMDVYERIFPGRIPSNKVHNFIDLSAHVFQQRSNEKTPDLTSEPEINKPENMSLTDPEKAYSILNNEVRGSLVNYPREFLLDETLEPSIMSAEFIAPNEIWT